MRSRRAKTQNMAGTHAQSGKMSLYKPASPLERGSLKQGSLHVSSPLVTPSSKTRDDSLPSPRGPPPSSHMLPSTDHTHSLSLSDHDETPPTTTPTAAQHLTITEQWSSDPPEVQVVRHVSSHELPYTHGRFSSNFVPLQPTNSASSNLREMHMPPTLILHTPGTERGDGEGEGVVVGVMEGGGGGGGGVSRSSSDHAVTSNRLTDKESDISVHSKSADLSTITENSVSSQAQKKKPRRGKGRVVPSRYMSSTTKATATTPSTTNTSVLQRSHATTTNTSVLQRSHATTTTTSSSSSKPHITRKPVKSAEMSKKKEDSFKIPAPPARARQKRPPPSLSTTLPHHPFTPSALTSSTPKIPGSATHTHTGTPHEDSLTDLSHNSTSNKSVATTKSKSNSSQVSDRELELLYSRLLQATYLDVMSAKSLREQEEAAKAQLQVLWQEVEQKRRECEALRQELETAKRTTALSSVLDVQVKELSPVTSVLPQLQQYHSELSRALDATRHELATSGVLPATEQQIEAELSRSEQLLAEIMSVLRHKVPTVVSLADSTEAAVNTLDNEFQELQKCWHELSEASKLQVHETSLTFEKKQRQRT